MAVRSFTSDPKLGNAHRHRSISVPSGAGGFNPLSISGLVAWYDFSDITKLWKDTGRTSAVTADGDIVLGVTDKSGVGHHLSEATNGPTYKAAIQNGRSILRFDGTNDILADATLNQSQPNTWFIVAKHATTANRHFFDGATTRQLLGVDGASHWTIFAGSVVSGTTVVDANFHQHSAVYNGASSGHWVDAAADPASANAGANAHVSLIVGKENGGAFLGCDIAEMLLYGSALGTTSRQTVEAYLKSKWGTP